MRPLPVDPTLDDRDDLSHAARHREGERAAQLAPPLSLAAVSLAAGRDPVASVRATQQGRLDSLFALRLGRMSETPFAFFRASAGLMADDPAAGPHSGLVAQLCGDAHANNFGLYGTDDGDIVMDINDFDETVRGPWEWDLKRLVTSIVLAGRQSGVSAKHVRDAAVDATHAYRRAVKRLAAVPYTESFVVMADELRLVGHKKLGADFERVLAKARANTSERVVDRTVDVTRDARTGERSAAFVDDPPVLFHVDDDEALAVMRGVQAYFTTMRASRKPLLARYRMVDVAFRVVGTGSVGLRNYLVLLEGTKDDWIVLQIKQAVAANLADAVHRALPDVAQHEGGQAERIVTGARVVQARTDHLLGSTSIDGDEYLVRQFRNAKGSLDPLELGGSSLDDYAQLCAAILARAHTRTLHPATLRGYLKGASDLDDALADYAQAYADQVERDRRAVVDALAAGEFGAPASAGG